MRVSDVIIEPQDASVLLYHVSCCSSCVCSFGLRKYVLLRVCIQDAGEGSPVDPPQTRGRRPPGTSSERSLAGLQLLEPVFEVLLLFFDLLQPPRRLRLISVELLPSFCDQ